MSLAPTLEIQQRVLRIARAEVGYQESPAGSNRTKYGAWYGLDGSAWCAQFVSWVFDQAGMRLPASTSKGFGYTPAGAAWFRSIGRWADATVTPLPGWVPFYDFPGDGVDRISHVGIVDTPRAGGCRAIEGNTDEAGGRTGGKVMLKDRTAAGGLVGYGVTFTAAELVEDLLTAHPNHEDDDMRHPTDGYLPLTIKQDGYGTLVVPEVLFDNMTSLTVRANDNGTMTGATLEGHPGFKGMLTIEAKGKPGTIGVVVGHTG